MYETSDRLYQLQFLSSVFLNATLSAQILKYWNNKPGQKKTVEHQGVPQEEEVEMSGVQVNLDTDEEI